MNIKYLLICIIFNVICYSSEFDLNELMFGPELTFTNSEILDAFKKEQEKINSSLDSQPGYQIKHTIEGVKKAKDLAAEIKKICEDCTVETKDYIPSVQALNITVKYPDNFKIFITLDPAVIEVKATPIAFKDLSRVTTKLENTLFQAAKNVGIGPSFGLGGGHIHLDASLFLKNTDLFRDFIVDIYNHPELIIEILGDFSRDDPIIQALSATRNKKFFELIERYDSSKMTTFQFVYELMKDVYSEPLNEVFEFENSTTKFKHHAINVLRMYERIKGITENQRTMELRFLRPQKNAKQFELICRLFKFRLEFLRKRRLAGRIEVPSKERYESIINRSKDNNLNRYITFLTESELAPRDYLRLLPYKYFDQVWSYIENNFEDSLLEKKKFLYEIAKDSPYDSVGSADFILKKSLEFSRETQSDLISQLDIRAEGSIEDLRLKRLIKKYQSIPYRVNSKIKSIVDPCLKYFSKNL